MKLNSAVMCLSALAQETRLKVFRALVQAGKTGKTPSELIELLDVPAATLSFHLKELAVAGLVNQQREGRSLTYRANFECMQKLLGFLTENCCQGQPC